MALRLKLPTFCPSLQLLIFKLLTSPRLPPRNVPHASPPPPPCRTSSSTVRTYTYTPPLSGFSFSLFSLSPAYPALDMPGEARSVPRLCEEVSPPLTLSLSRSVSQHCAKRSPHLLARPEFLTPPAPCTLFPRHFLPALTVFPWPLPPPLPSLTAPHLAAASYVVSFDSREVYGGHFCCPFFVLFF